MRPKDDLKLDAIERATHQCVLERGLTALTLTDIARVGGIATSTLYVYFPSRQALLDELYARAKTESYEHLMSGVGASLPLKARVRQIWTNLLEARLQHPAKLAFLEQYAYSEGVSDTNRALSARLMQVFHAMLESGQRDEILKAAPLPMLVTTIAGSAQETGKLVQSKSIEDHAENREWAFRLCWDALKA